MNKLLMIIPSVLLSLAVSSAVNAEEPAMRDRQAEIQNEELRRAVAADRDAAQLAHEQDMAKQRAADAQRIAEMDKSKERYKEVVAEREANEKRTAQEKEQAREQKRAEKSQKSEKQKTK